MTSIDIKDKGWQNKKEVEGKGRPKGRQSREKKSDHKMGASFASAPIKIVIESKVFMSNFTQCCFLKEFNSKIGKNIKEQKINHHLIQKNSLWALYTLQNCHDTCILLRKRHSDPRIWQKKG